MSLAEPYFPGGTRYSLKVTGELKKWEEFGNIVIKEENGRIIRMRDVAKISFGCTREPSTISRLNGNPSLAINMTKRTGENIIRIVDEAKKSLRNRVLLGLKELTSNTPWINRVTFGRW